MSDLVEKIKRTLQRYRMIEPRDKVLVAVSGGADSVALLNLLQEIKAELQIELCVAHLNHGVRGSEAQEDAEFVRSLGRKLGLETRIGFVDMKNPGAGEKASFQEAARKVRYSFLESEKEKLGANKIALGHTGDDQVETVLMNLLRGSGLKGLTGIPVKRGGLIRPLRECFRAEIESYMAENKLPFRTDPSNFVTVYPRNRIRRDLIPKLLHEYNPNLKSRIFETADILRDDEDYLETVVEEIYQVARYSTEAGGIGLRRSTLLNLHPALQKRLVRRAFFHAKGNLRRLTARHVHDAITLLGRNRPAKFLQLPGGVIIRLEGEGLVFYVNPKDRDFISNNRADTPAGQVVLSVPGETGAGLFALKFISRLVSPGQYDYRLSSAHRACLDFDKTGKGIIVRCFHPGDRFVPLGMNGTKKLKSFFIDEKIPREIRQSIPILTTANDNIIWVYGKRISNNYRITGATRNILIIDGVAV